MTGRIRSVSGHDVHWLSEGWELAASPAGTVGEPGAALDALLWQPAVVPSTVAAVLQKSGDWSLDGAVRRFDADDWWYRGRFSTPSAGPGEQLWLCFDGLATVAEVWLNGRLLLSSNSMFVARECRIESQLRAQNDLVICFRSLDALLKARRPRPRWRVPMVEHQQIRWFRTTLLGRTPGWSLAAAPVGPWGGIRLERRRGVVISDVGLRADAQGRLDVTCRVSSLTGGKSSVEIVLEREGREYAATLAATGSTDVVAGHLVIPGVQRWWPHTHGDPALYAARLRIRHGAGSTDADLGKVGFRSIGLATAGGDFQIDVNGVAVFCRGACWTPLDPVGFAVLPQALEQTFKQVAAAGMNMLRVGGTMVYESDHFLDQCDARGVLLWHEFMFANMDYPEDDDEFARNVNEEARQQFERLQGRPSLAILCGNSEGEQQAAMWGAPRQRWQPALFHDRLAALAREACPDVPYWPSSAHGGEFPHQGNFGTTSYFGVGAYLRPLDDARRAEVRFASECLAFANVPEERTLAALPEGHRSKVHLASWKSHSPRDLGAGWDFDDVRDYYFAKLFRMDPLLLRYSDHDRYLALGRVVTGEVMAAVFSEWRRRRSVTRGGLVWFFRDLWAGAGWGIIDANGTPKAAWHYLRRAFAPVALALTDEGGNGVALHVVNDPAIELNATVEVVLYRAGEVVVGRATRPITVAAHSALEVNVGSFFDEFLDLSYAYRFGPPSHDLIVATLRDAAGHQRAQAFYFVLGPPNSQERDVGLSAEMRPGADGCYDLLVRARRFAQAVTVDVEGFAGDDDYFHLAPGGERHILLRPTGTPATPAIPRGTLRALNAEVPATILHAS